MTACDVNVRISVTILTQGDASQTFHFIAHTVNDNIYLPPGGEERQGRLTLPKPYTEGTVWRHRYNSLVARGWDAPPYSCTRERNDSR